MCLCVLVLLCWAALLLLCLASIRMIVCLRRLKLLFHLVLQRSHCALCQQYFVDHHIRQSGWMHRSLQPELYGHEDDDDDDDDDNDDSE